MKRSRGFTLIELLVVISVIALLLSILLPSLSRVKEQAKAALCMSNMRQLGITFQMYVLDDKKNHFPRGNDNLMFNGDFEFAYGGDEQTVFGLIVNLPEPEDRLLYPYLQELDVYKCPADRGMEMPFAGGQWKPSVFESVGNSYRYNYYLWNNETRESVADPIGIADKPENWVPSPSRYILLHEPPALRWAYGDLYFIWHFAKGETTVADPSINNNRFISDILFVDGHVGRHDFTDVLQDKTTVVEPTSKWIWYKPGSSTEDPVW